MFIAIVRFPPMNSAQHKEFREWFEWSNQLLKNCHGFISRKLILGRDKTYIAIVEHRYDTFTAMLSSNEHKLVHERVLSLFNGTPKSEFFEIVST